MLSTLRSDVEAMGGSLKLLVEFPDRAPVVLDGLGDTDAPADKARRNDSAARPVWQGRALVLDMRHHRSDHRAFRVNHTDGGIRVA